VIRLSTRGRIILLVVLAALPALALTVYSTWNERVRSELQARDDLRRLAMLEAQRQEQIFEGAKQTLAAISMVSASVRGDQTRCNEFLAKLQAQSSGLYHSMGIYGADGLLLCNAVPWEGKLFSVDRLYLRLPMTTGKFAIGNYQVGRVTKQQGINVGYPITDSAGNVIAVAFVAIDLEKLNSMAAATPLPENGFVAIVDRDGVILTRHPMIAGRVGNKIQSPQVLETVLSGRSGIFQMKATDGSERLWAYETVADNPDGVIPLRVLVSIPMNVVFAKADQVFIRNLISSALAAALLLIAAWYGTEFFVLRKIRALLDAASRVRAGDLSARTGLRYEGEELSQIGAAFDEMALTLQDRDVRLKHVLRELSEQATTDPLTGLYNRRYLPDFFQRELERAARSATPVAAIMLDIDHFKRINDAFGHAAGDLVLTELAGLLKHHNRGSDMVCRYGGEEFLLILPGASLDGARQRAENIRTLIKNLELKYHDQPLGMITASFGVALFPDDAEGAQSLIHAADEALFEAKAAGRDRVVVRRSTR
jgi:diguanylate cyclase (GGDEF)-like protein